MNDFKSRKKNKEDPRNIREFSKSVDGFDPTYGVRIRELQSHEASFRNPATNPENTIESYDEAVTPGLSEKNKNPYGRHRRPKYEMY